MQTKRRYSIHPTHKNKNYAQKQKHKKKIKIQKRINRDRMQIVDQRNTEI